MDDLRLHLFTRAVLDKISDINFTGWLKSFESDTL